MNYYKRHIGDYAAATRHLSLLEHGVYTILMDVYYGSEKALPLEPRDVQRLVGARSEDERQAVDVVLAEFFEKRDDGWHQNRCDEEIAHKQEKGVANQAIGKMGGRPKQITDSVIPESDSVPEQSETDSAEVSSQKPNGTQANSHKPVTNREEIAAGKPTAIPVCPHLELIDLFGKHLPELPQPKPELWTGKNADAMRSRWRWVLTARTRGGKRYATTEAEALDWFDRFFRYVSSSDFLTGRSGKWTNCDLSWLMKADNFAKVVQGNYENKGGA